MDKQTEQMFAVMQSRIDNLEKKFDSPIVRANRGVDELTPYTETKTAYYGEKEKPFYNVPNGNVTVFFSNYTGDYSINRISDRVTVSFDTLTEQTDITISIQ